MKPGRAGKILFLLLLLFIPTDVLLAQCVPTSTAAGSLDNCFGNGGMVVTDITPDRDFARAMAIQSDGKIVVAGVAGYNASSNISDFLVVRYNVDGSLDPTFDGDGIVVTDFGFGAVDDDYCRGVAIQPDGKIILAGRSQVTAETYALAVVRYNPDGSLDSTFDGDGKAQFELGAIVEMYGFALQPDGKMLVAGRSFSFSTHTYTGLIARFNSNGSVDTTFGTNGSTSASISGVFSLAVQTDGKILAGGSQGNDPAFAIVRLHADGSPDLSFGSGGVLIHHPTLSDQMWFLKIRFDNLIFAGGHSSAIAGDPRGALLSIGNGGTLAQGALYPQQNAFWNMTFQPDGKALVVGASHLPRSGFMIRRYTDINTPDLTFNGGLTFAKFLPDNVPEASGINAIAMTGDNKIVAVGSVTEEDNRTSGWRLAVARFHSGLPVPHPERFDFDGDRKADASIFRPSNGQWWYLRSSDGVAAAFQFGTGTDMITPGDYTGDGRTDIGIWRPSTGEWFILRSESFTYYSVPFGTSGDIPRPSDFDGDGKTDLIVYRPSTGVWYRTNSIGINSFREFGKGEPITGDFDGDGRSDLAVYRPATGEWSYESSRTSLRVSFHWGLPSDLPAPADFDGDGMTDIAVYRPSNGTWYVVNSSDGSFRIVNFGVGEDKPVPADYDGDGKFDLAVFRPSSGIWYLLRSTAGFTAVQFGLAEDIPIPGAFLD